MWLKQLKNPPDSPFFKGGKSVPGNKFLPLITPVPAPGSVAMTMNELFRLKFEFVIADPVLEQAGILPRPPVRSLSSIFSFWPDE